MNPHAEALLQRIQDELKFLSARAAEKEHALEAIRRQGEERWQAWQAQWQHWRDRAGEHANELMASRSRATQLVEHTEAELEQIEASLRDCIAVGAGLDAQLAAP